MNIIGVFIEIALFLMPVAVFCFFIDRNRIKELYPTGLWAAFFAIFMNNFGEMLELWLYQSKILISHIYTPKSFCW